MEDSTNAVSPDGYGLGSETSIVIPRGHAGLPPMVFDMTSIYKIVARTAEVERVVPATYAALVTDFNMGMIQLNRLVGLIDIELRESENGVDMARAIASLERVEPFLESKKIKSTADSRDAAITMDKDVQSAIRTRDALLATLAYAKGLKESLERAYFSAKQATDLISKDPYLNKTSGDRYVK
jgi:hypothetical protein